MIKAIRYGTPMKDVDFEIPTVFLAGCTVRGNQLHLKSWRPDAVKLFREYGFEGNIIIPEFSNPTESDKHRPDLPPWEFEGLRRCNVIMFWIPRTRELIGLTSNFEMGYWLAKRRDKMVYGRPDDAYRMQYCDIMWVEDGKYWFRDNPADFSIHNTLEKTVKASIEKMR